MRCTRLRSVWFIPAVAGLIVGCGNEVTGPRGGVIHIAMAMAGPASDPDGALVSVDTGAAVSIFAGEMKEFTGVLSGSHIVRLSGLAPGCTVSGDNPRAVVVVDGQITEARFDVSCVVSETTGPDPAEVIATGGLYPEATPHDSVLSSMASRELREDGPWSCTTERHSAEEAPDDYATFDPNAEVIYPGAMLQGATLVDATPEPIVVGRAGGTVAINLLNGSSGVSQQVTEVKQSTVAQAINDILAQNTGIVPARFTYTSSEVQSREQLALSLGVNVSTLSTDFKSHLSFSTDRQYNRFLVQMTQSFYTVVFDLPGSLHDLIADGVTGAQIAPYVGPGNPATYISSVTYGRRFFLLIESTSSVQEMQASIRASYDGAVVSGSISSGATYVKDLKNVNIKVFALGGDQSMATAMFNGDYEAVKTFLTQGADIRTGVPLSYVVRNVLGNSVVAVKVATDYDVKTCIPMAPAQLYSAFDADAEGWTAFNNGSTEPGWSTATTCAGGMGGCLSIVWSFTNGAYIRAPQTWLGGKNWSGFYGGTLDYYLRLIYTTGISIGGTGWMRGYPHVVIQNRAGNQLTLTLPDALLGQSAQGWTLVPLTISDSGTGLGTSTVKWQYGGHDATEAEIKSVLAEVTDFRLLTGLRHDMTQTARVDQVTVLGPAPSPGSPARAGAVRRPRRGS